MLKCSNCSLEQSEGKFCGSCGGALEDASNEQKEVVALEEKEDNEQLPNEQPEQQRATTESQEQPTQTADPVQQATQAEAEIAASQAPPIPNDTKEKIIEKSKVYGAYFLEYLKTPSRIFSVREKELTNGLFSLVIISILLALSLTKIVANFTTPFFNTQFSIDAFIERPSFFLIFLNTLLFVIVMIAVTISLLFVINKLFGTGYSFKEITSIFGAHMTPVIIAVSLSLIFALIKSNTAAITLLLISAALVATTVPIYLISRLLSKQSKALDALYGYLLYIATSGFVYFILFGIFIDSKIGSLYRDLPNW